MAKIERKFLAHFVNAKKPGSAQDSYVRLGKDLEEYAAELSATVDTKNNILGETSVLLSAYEKQASVEPWYAEKDEPLFERLQTIIDESQVLDDCVTDVVEVHLWEEESSVGVFPATREGAVFEVKSYGGDTTGYQIPFALHYTGDKQKGNFDLTTRTFTAL